MAKYIIDVPDNTQWIQWMNVSEKDGSACFDYKAPEDLTPYVRSESYIDELKKGQNEAWEFVRELIHCNNGIGMRDDELRSCFGYELYSQVFKHLSYQESKAKFDAWKKKRFL